LTGLTIARYGAPDGLAVVAFEPKPPGPRELLVEVAASGVTQADRRIRSGEFPGVMFVPARLALGLTGPRRMPLGTTYAGRVVACGHETSGFAVGDRVFGEVMYGAHASHVCVSAQGAIARTPAGVSDIDAAALVYGSITAVTFLRTLANVAPNERVCILGASGGVGRVAVQVAKALGAHVTAVCSADHTELVRRCGADHVVDYRSSAYDADSARYDVILDTVAAVRFADARRALRPGGRYLCLLVSLRLLVDVLRTRRSDRRAFMGAAFADRAVMDAIAAWIDAGTLRANVAATYAFHDAHEAHACLERGNPGGELVIDMARAR